MENRTQANVKPIKIIKKDISSTDVARYYLEIEFFKLFKNPSKETAATIVNTIQNLSDSKIWALLEAMSFTYHTNGVFYKISKKDYIWNEEMWHVKDLILTGMDSRANKVIFSKEVNGDTLKFKDYLTNYFRNTDESDPEGLLSYKPTNKEVTFDKLIMTEEEGTTRMLDGSHRLTEMLLTGVEEVTAYVGHPVGEHAEKNPKVRIGNSTFIMLTIMFKKGDQKEKEAVLTLVNQLISSSIDGKEAVQKFWVDKQQDDEIKKAGIKLLEGM